MHNDMYCLLSGYKLQNCHREIRYHYSMILVVHVSSDENNQILNPLLRVLMKFFPLIIWWYMHNFDISVFT